MEKKGNRLVQPLTKGIGTDSKKSQDVNKPLPRGGRRREPSGGAFPKPSNDFSRKPAPQRTKNWDKRPRARGYCHSGAVGGKEEPGLDAELEAELGSVFLQGSKKQSLNHLINFHFEPRENLGSVPVFKGGNRWNSVSKHKYNKEEFLQANCQFVVQESGDYKAYMTNPDALVDWNLIEQVNLQVLEFPSCPICLYTPVAAKMTRCGHIYCWPCLLHYLALSDKTWRKCPICFEAIHKNDLKSVITVPHTSFNINDEITFKLMKRQKGSLITYPADFEAQDDTILNMCDKNVSNVYFKLLLAGKSEVASIIERERVQLLTQLAEDEFCPERCFVEQALALVQEREMEEKVQDRNVGKTENVFDLELAPEAPSKWHYFYQAYDGQHIYLHALNVRMLEYTYGSLEFSPKTIMGRILEKESGSITEDLRKRLRYLQHLPITCQFEVAEIVLTAPVVSPESLHYFHEQIEARRKHRQRRARDERHREKRILEEENKKIGKYPISDIKLESNQHFPDFQSLSLVEVETPPTSATPTPTSSVTSSLNNENEYTGLSFAKMLAANKSSPSQVWPTRKSATSLPIVNRPQLNSDVDNESYASVPAYNQSFHDGILSVVEKVALNNAEDQQNKNGKKKKKKNKEKTVLFATSMVYSNN